MNNGDLEVFLKIKRQDAPDGIFYWERFELRAPADASLLSVIAQISENPVTDEGDPCTHVCVDSSCKNGVCGSCAMIVNGRPMLACKTKIGDLDSRITVEPISKFPVIRDLVVDRSSMLDAFLNYELWSDSDSSSHFTVTDFARFDAGLQGLSASFVDCIMCGLCLEACPSVNSRSKFPGAWLFGIMLGMNLNSYDFSTIRRRKLTAAGAEGLALCEGVGNCSKFCPMGLRLSDAIGMMGAAAASQSLIDFVREER